MNRLSQDTLTWQELSLTGTHTFSPWRGLVNSSPKEPSGCSSVGGTSGRGILKRGTSGRGTSWRGTWGTGTSLRGRSGRLFPATDSLSSCWSTLISEVFPASSASRWVGTAWQGICGCTSPNNSCPLRGWVSGVCGGGWGSGVCGCSGETVELEDSEHNGNTLPHLSRHPNEIPEKERFWLDERRRQVRQDDTTWLWRCTQFCGSTRSRGQCEWDQKMGMIQW